MKIMNNQIDNYYSTMVSQENILSKTEKKFKFFDEKNKKDCDYTLCNITIIEKENVSLNENIKYFCIYYDYIHFQNGKEYIPDELPLTHPFKRFNDDSISVEGTEIIKNDFTSMLIKYLKLSFEDLKKHSGNTTPQTYKSNIMKTIDLFWD